MAQRYRYPLIYANSSFFTITTLAGSPKLREAATPVVICLGHDHIKNVEKAHLRINRHFDTSLPSSLINGTGDVRQSQALQEMTQ